jgi:FlaG/FlaF family flagellin (archaellin)
MDTVPSARRGLAMVAATLSALVIGTSLLIGLAGTAGAVVTGQGSSANVQDLTTATLTPAFGVIPLSADTCSDSVCIYVVGSGLNVSSWTTTVVLPSSMCSYAKFLENGVVIAESPQGCASAGDQLSTEWVNPGNFPNGTRLCNEWSGIAGEPCITVHS